MFLFIFYLLFKFKVDKFIQELLENAPRHGDDSDSDMEVDIFTNQKRMSIAPPGGVKSTTIVPPINTAQTTTTVPVSTTDSDESPQDTCDRRRQKVEEAKTPRIPKVNFYCSLC